MRFVPRTALFRGDKGDWEAFRITPRGRAERVRLEIGLMNDYQAEVRAGLDLGDRVIVAPEARREEGQRVAGTS